MSVAADAAARTATARAAQPDGSRGQERRPRSPVALVALAFLALLGIAGLTALGVWQLERRVWKLDLIERVDRRVHAAPVAAPGPTAWPAITAPRDEYRRVSVTGHFLDQRDTLVQAVTERGRGFWVLTPFRTTDGWTVLVNRGFVPPGWRGEDTGTAGKTAGETVVTGLLRMSEPKGGFLRSNDPGHDRWYSRDTAAIAATRRLSDVAPYFIDADAGPGPDALPQGGMTVIAFPNNHLVYALTWFGLALMLGGATIFVARDEWFARRRPESTGKVAHPSR